MFYELREYTVIPGRMPALVQRFKDHTFTLLDKHNIDVTLIAHTEMGENSLNEIVYAIRWESYEEMQAGWGAVAADPEWHRVKAESEADGPMMSAIRRRILNTAPFDSSR